MIAILCLYFGINIGILITCIDFELDNEFKANVLHDTNNQRLYSNTDLLTIFILGGPLLVWEIIEKALTKD